jgi:hypothetical protein
MGLFSSDAAAPPPPNYAPLIGQLQGQSAYAQGLSKEQQDWARQAYGANRGYNEAVQASDARTQQDMGDWSRADRARYEGQFVPLQDRAIADANSYDNPDNMNRMRGRAQAEVGMNFDAAGETAKRSLEGYGINPAAVRYAGLDRGVQMQRAAASAAAANQSDLATEGTARNMRTRAIQMGSALPGQAVGEAGAGVQAGATGAQTGLATTASGANTMGTGAQWYAGANAPLGQAGNMMNQSYENQMAKYKADQSQSSGWGTLAGIAGGIAGSYLGGPAGGAAATAGMKKLFSGPSDYAEGGAVPDPGQDPSQDPSQDPNLVPAGASPSGGKAIDDVSARVSSGEFILPRDVVEWLGEEKLQNLIKKAREGKQGAGAKPKARQAIQTMPTYMSPGASAIPMHA